MVVEGADQIHQNYPVWKAEAKKWYEDAKDKWNKNTTIMNDRWGIRILSAGIGIGAIILSFL